MKKESLPCGCHKDDGGEWMICSEHVYMVVDIIESTERIGKMKKYSYSDLWRARIEGLLIGTFVASIVWLLMRGSP